MKIHQLEENTKKFLKGLKKLSSGDFVFEFLAVFGIQSATIARLKSGNINLAPKNSSQDTVLLKNKLYYETVSGDLFTALQKAESNEKVLSHTPRFIVLTDNESLMVRDTKSDDLLDCAIADLAKEYHFFQSLAGIENVHFEDEREADIKASEKMARLFEMIRLENAEDERLDPHTLNVFMTRLLFCLFAEDTHIFPDNAFTNFIQTHTKADASDLHLELAKIFQVLNQKSSAKENKIYKPFPYVNGGLFADELPVPRFTAKARRLLLDCGRQSWAEIHPDIFGSMFQGVIDPDKRHNLGMHYTSVTNIMKVIKPLFLDQLYEDFGKCKESATKLHKFHQRLSEIKIFDPACGSGNFLIIAYKELRKLEMQVIDQLNTLENNQALTTLSRISVNQFFGIEIDDFASEIAVLALWLAEHQANLEFKNRFGQAPPSLPLKEGAQITCANATRYDWNEACPKTKTDEVYVLGNPPYLGSSIQDKSQKADMASVFEGVKNYKNLDYIACWFYLGSQYIQNSKASLAFVTTKSICQGEQVALLWPLIYTCNLEINFAYQNFRWTNNARGNAGVICVIVGITQKNSEKKKLSRLPIHIPSVNSGESTKDKHEEVNTIIGLLGKFIDQDSETGIITVKTKEGKILRIADLVWDQGKDRDRVMEFLRDVKTPECIDIIIALGMAKEGFDWAFCEHALTIGYRGSLTEIIQIIGRCTRDSSNKTHAQFTNLIAQPDAENEEVNSAVNNMLKAITCSLLMEQVLAPSFKFKRKKDDEDISQGDNIFIRGLKEPSSQRVKDIIESDLNDLKATIMQDDTVVKAAGGTVDPEVINTVLIPKVIATKYPDLDNDQVEELRQHVVADCNIKTAETKQAGDNRLIKMGSSFINIEDLSIELIDQINPFQKAFEILSKSVNAKTLRAIKESIESTKIQMTFEEAATLWPKLKKFRTEQGKLPDIYSSDPLEKRLAEARIYMQNMRRDQNV